MVVDSSIAGAGDADAPPAAVATAIATALCSGPDAVCLLAADGTIRWASPAARAMHPRVAALVGARLGALCEEMRDEGLVAMVRAVAEGGGARSILPVTDGHGRWFAGTLTPATPADGVLLLAWEVTTRVQQSRWLREQRALLGQLAAGAPLHDMLASLVRAIERLAPGTTGSVLRITDDGRLAAGAAPNLPPEFSAALVGLPIGPSAGSCGTAAWRGRPVIVADIATDPLWADYRDLVLPLGYRACWSVPVIADATETRPARVIATFALYRREVGAPVDGDRHLLEEAAQFAKALYAAAAVREREAMLARILEETTDLAGTADPEGRSIWLNRAAREFLGATSEGALARRSVLDFYAPHTRAALADEGEHAPITTALREGSWQGESVLVAGDGTEVPVSQVILAHHDEQGVPRFISTIARDLTPERDAAAALAASEARFRALTDASPVGVYETDPAGHCTYANATLAAITGWRQEALLGDAWLSAVDAEDLPLVLANWRRYLETGRSESTSYRFRRPDGTVRHLLWTTAPLRGVAGDVTGHVGIVQDVTAQRDEAANQLAIARERSELAARAQHAQRMEALGALAGGVAHDFNNLLSVIRGGLELLRDDVAPASPARREVDAVAEAAVRATELTQRLLAFSRHQVLQPTALDLNAVIQGAAGMLSRVIGGTITLRTALAPQAGTIHADRGQLEQVLVNLVVNARDAMPGGGEIVLETTEVAGGEEPRWSGAPDVRLARLVVRDTGEGMDEVTLARAMEPFFTTKPVGRGTGLGLSMAYGVVTQSGGVLALASRPGTGTTVTILLPLDAIPAEAHPSPATDAPAAGDVPHAPLPITVAPGARPCVLVVEDEPALRSLMRRALERGGWQVCEAANGADGLALWRSGRCDVNAILTDLRMPEMGGREMVAAIRADGGTLPVLWTSGYADEAFTVDAAGEAFLAKPFTARALLEAMARVTATRPAPGP
jgi:PAS domain S-box-containing protein